MATNHVAQHIMVVEDDPSLADWMADYLSSHGFEVSVASRGDDALELLHTDTPDALLLDLNLPNIDGVEVCRQARLFYDKPILMITARDTDTDEIIGLDNGADDYLNKPVKPRILLARLRALLRRYQSNEESSILEIGALKIDLTSRTVLLHERAVALSTHEFDVLARLAKNAGTVSTREELIGELRGIEYDGFDRSVDICISRLRRKLKDDAAQPVKIKTLRGIGYLLTVDGWSTQT